MRPLLTLAAAVLLSAPALQAQDARVHRLASAPLAVTLPGAFETAGEAEAGPGVTVQMFTAPDADDGPATRVFVDTHHGLSFVRRLLFRHGVGIAREMVAFEVEHVALDGLEISESLAASATSAFSFRTNDGRSVGVIVRGCEGAVCYAVAAKGPRHAGAPDGAAYAGLLAGVEVGG